MKSKTVNIAFLALFHVLLFVAPFTAKALHHDERIDSFIPGILSSKEDYCPICHFEFVAFKHPVLSKVIMSQHESVVDFPIENDKVFIPCLIYFTLRAPPQC